MSWKKASFIFLIFCGVLAMTGLPSLVGYFLVSGALVIFLFILSTTGQFVLPIQSKPLVLLMPILFIFITHMVVNPNSDVLLRGATFVSSALISIFIIPNHISKDYFEYIIANTATLLVLIGLPWYFIELSSYPELPSLHNWPILFLTTSGTGVPKYSSILTNPNYFAIILVIGFLCALSQLNRQNITFMHLSVLVIGLGLFLTQSRGSLTGICASLFILFSFKYTSSSTQQIIIGATLSSILFVYLIIVGSFSQLIQIDQISSSYRDALWYAGINAFYDRPILGWGPTISSDILQPYVSPDLSGVSVHNSFLRIFMTTGLIGGISYTTFSILFISNQWYLKNRPYLVALASGLIVNQIFNEFTLFGIGLPSILTALVFGYLYLPDKK